MVPVQEAARWLAQNAQQDAAASRPVAALLAEACTPGRWTSTRSAPPLAAAVSERPVASPIVRWQAARQPNLTNLRHEPMRIDDPHALAMLALLDGTRTRDDLVAVLASRMIVHGPDLSSIPSQFPIQEVSPIVTFHHHFTDSTTEILFKSILILLGDSSLIDSKAIEVGDYRC